MTDLKNEKPKIRKATFVDKIRFMPSMIRKRISNMRSIYPEHFRNDPCRSQECADALKLIRRHPWWLIMWKPKIPQTNSVEKMAFSIIRGPIWQWEAEDRLNYIKTHPKTGVHMKLPPEEVHAIMKEIDERKQKQKIHGV